MKETANPSGVQPKTLEATSSIITYSPSKFLTRVGAGKSTYTTHTHTSTTTATATATATKTNNAPVGGASSSYYVVKAGSLGSAASMTGSIKVSSPPKATPVIKSPALVITSPSTPTESVMFSLDSRGTISPTNQTSTACAPRSPSQIIHLTNVPF